VQVLTTRQQALLCAIPTKVNQANKLKARMPLFYMYLRIYNVRTLYGFY